jgi:hypothetical protein
MIRFSHPQPSDCKIVNGKPHLWSHPIGLINRSVLIEALLKLCFHCVFLNDQQWCSIWSTIRFSHPQPDCKIVDGKPHLWSHTIGLVHRPVLIEALFKLCFLESSTITFSNQWLYFLIVDEIIASSMTIGGIWKRFTAGKKNWTSSSIFSENGSVDIIIKQYCRSFEKKTFIGKNENK